jgi:rod shape-determining protein MreD
MGRLVSSNIIRFVFLVLLQGLVLNSINLGGLINPYLYILILLMLPVELPSWALMVFGLVVGISVDAFSNTLGMHASASVFICFCRPYVLKLLSPREGYEFSGALHLQRMGFLWFISYAGTMILLHHLWLYNVEVLRPSEFLNILLKTLSSGVFTLGLVLLSQYLTFKRKASK